MDIPIIECSDILKTGIGNPYACNVDETEDPLIGIFVPTAYRLNPTTSTPRFADFQTLLIAGNALLVSFVSGTVNKPTSTEVAPQDTLSGEKEYINIKRSVTGKIQNINNNNLFAYKWNSLNHKVMYAYFIGRTTGRVIIGGARGVKVNAQLLPWEKAPLGTAFIEKTWEFEEPKDSYLAIGEPDEDNLTLENLINTGTITLSGAAAPSFKASSFLNINGWVKADYPILYGKVSPADDTLTIYKDVALLNSVATVELADPLLAGTVTETNSSGFSGTIELTAVTPILNDLLTISYS